MTKLLAFALSFHRSATKPGTDVKAPATATAPVVLREKDLAQVSGGKLPIDRW